MYSPWSALKGCTGTFAGAWFSGRRLTASQGKASVNDSGLNVSMDLRGCWMVGRTPIMLCPDNVAHEFVARKAD
jgi:hypothetical protein